MKRGFQKCDLEESVDLALDALLASRVEHLLETVVPSGKKIYQLKWKLTNETTRGQRKWRISLKRCSGWLNILFQFLKCGGPVRNTTLYVSLHIPDNNVFIIIIIMEQLPLNLQSHLCQLGFVLLRELVGAPFANGGEPFWKVFLLLKIKLANSPLVLFLHHLADHSHSLLSASCHCWLVQLRKNLVRCCIECMNTWIEDCNF